MGNIYTFGPTFRAERSFTPRHLSEFWMVEPELAFCDLQGVSRCAEAYIKHCCTAVLNKCGEEMAFFVKRYDGSVENRVKRIAEAPFVRMEYSDAIEELKKVIFICEKSACELVACLGA